MTNYLPLTLGVSSSSGRTAQSSVSPTLKQQVFERDGHTCRFCGFQAQKYQEIHFLDGKPENTALNNLFTSCIFCNQCSALDHVAEMRAGVLIWLPEISQAALHHMTRAIYVARISQGPMADAARKSLDTLMQRREAVRDRLGTDDPSILASILQDYISPRAYKARAKKLDGLRLFPLDRRIIKEADLEFNQFPQILAYWRSKDGPFGGRVPAKWIEIYKDVALPQAA